jgi:hypothetical protein
MLLELPKQPVVLYISHCLLADFKLEEGDVDQHGLKDKVWRPLGQFETSREFERKLAAHYGLLYVDTCAAFRSFMEASRYCLNPSLTVKYHRHHRKYHQPRANSPPPPPFPPRGCGPKS